MVQFTSIHDYWKNHGLTRWTFVWEVMSLLFNMLSRLVIAFLPRSECLLISLLHSPSAVILEPMSRLVIAFLPRSECLLISLLHSPSAVILEPKIMKSDTVSIISPSICLEVMG